MEAAFVSDIRVVMSKERGVALTQKNADPWGAELTDKRSVIIS